MLLILKLQADLSVKYQSLNLQFLISYINKKHQIAQTLTKRTKLAEVARMATLGRIANSPASTIG